MKTYNTVAAPTKWLASEERNWGKHSSVFVTVAITINKLNSSVRARTAVGEELALGLENPDLPAVPLYQSRPAGFFYGDVREEHEPVSRFDVGR